MPELPEVESTAASMRAVALHKTITGLTVSWERMVLPLTVKTLRAKIIGLTISAIDRRGKYLVLSLKNSMNEERGFLIIHLRMSGRLRIERSEQEAKESEETEFEGTESREKKYDRICVALLDGLEIRFQDVRKFGRLSWFSDREREELYARLGVEPLSDGFTTAVLNSLLKSSRQKIKGLLLDQHKIAGLGNIYVDESLWLAEIHPERISETISQQETERLCKAIRDILREAIKLNGTDFGDGVVHNGKFITQVYGRAGKLCKRCKSEIKKVKVAGRGTSVCTMCQI